MITHEELESINFYRQSKVHYYDWKQEFLYNKSDSCLYEHCEVDGELNLIDKFTNIQDLKECIYKIYSHATQVDIETFFKEEFKL